MKERNSVRQGDALIVVDLQNDFCPGGAMAVKGGDAILPAVNAWIERARGGGIPVYASRDWHPREHVSFAEQGGEWQPHCIQDTPGAAFHPDLQLPDDVLVISKGVRFDRDQNSVFDGTGLAEHFRDRGIRRVLMCGLALDFCVRASVMDALQAGFEVVVITEGTRPVEAERTAEVMARMQKAGAALTDPDALKSEEASAGGPETELDFCTKAPEWAEHERLQDTDIACDDGRRGKI